MQPKISKDDFKKLYNKIQNISKKKYNIYMKNVLLNKPPDNLTEKLINSYGHNHIYDILKKIYQLNPKFQPKLRITDEIEHITIEADLNNGNDNTKEYNGYNKRRQENYNTYEEYDDDEDDDEDDKDDDDDDDDDEDEEDKDDYNNYNNKSKKSIINLNNILNDTNNNNMASNILFNNNEDDALNTDSNDFIENLKKMLFNDNDNNDDGNNDNGNNGIFNNNTDNDDSDNNATSDKIPDFIKKILGNDQKQLQGKVTIVNDNNGVTIEPANVTSDIVSSFKTIIEYLKKLTDDLENKELLLLNKELKLID